MFAFGEILKEYLLLAAGGRIITGLRVPASYDGKQFLKNGAFIVSDAGKAHFRFYMQAVGNVLLFIMHQFVVVVEAAVQEISFPFIPFRFSCISSVALNCGAGGTDFVFVVKQHCIFQVLVAGHIIFRE